MNDEKGRTMKLSALVFSGSLLATTLASATTATYQYCDDANNVSSCRAGGSATVVSNYDQTKYPVILAHGMGGISAIG